MGGFGSGGPPRRTGPLVEDLFKLTVKSLRLGGLLGKNFASVTSSAETNPDRVFLVGDQNGVTAFYELIDRHIKQRIEYEVMHHVRGGCQYYFICPSCSKKREALYIHDDLACRVCHGAVYASENLGKLNRAMRSRARIASNLGCCPDEILPEKPPFMHWSTHKHNYLKLAEAQWLLARLERSRYGKLETYANRLPSGSDKTDGV